MKNKAKETFNQLKVCADDYKKTILHIPHSSPYVPSTLGYVTTVIQENLLLIDHSINKIFNIGVDKLIFPFSRIFCDVERHPDYKEPMDGKGMGFFYTHKDNGELLRRDEYNIKNYIYENIYLKHHFDLNKMVENKLDKYGTCRLVDCHSFSDVPFKRDSNQELNRPDICIGIDSFHTPNYLKEVYVDYFKNLGYDVRINDPYKGCMIPTEFVNKDKNVECIMIEINRKLYMENSVVLPEKVKKLNEIMEILIN